MGSRGRVRWGGGEWNFMSTEVIIPFVNLLSCACLDSVSTFLIPLRSLILSKSLFSLPSLSLFHFLFVRVHVSVSPPPLYICIYIYLRLLPLNSLVSFLFHSLSVCLSFFVFVCMYVCICLF